MGPDALQECYRRYQRELYLYLRALCAIADIQDQGLWLDGFALVGTREDLLALRDVPLISYIHTVPMA